MSIDFLNWYNDFLFIAKTKYCFPEKRVNEIRPIIEEYYWEGIPAVATADQELGWE